MTPRLMRSSCSSSRRLAVLVRRSSAANTDQYDVKPISTPNSTTTSAKRRTIGAFTGSRSLRLAPPPVGDQQQQREQDEVGQDRGAAVGDERQRHAGQRDHA